MAAPSAIAWTFSVGQLASVPVRLHVLLPALPICLLFDHMKSTWAMLGFIAIVFGPVLWLTVLLHELGHCLATKALGSEVHGILLWPLGGLAFMGKSSSPREDLMVAGAGPLTHIPQFAFWAGLFFVVGSTVDDRAMYPVLATAVSHGLGLQLYKGHFLLSIFAAAAKMNVWLMMFNLFIPAYPLDGGRIFADLLLMAGVVADLAAKIVAGVALTIAVGLVVYGFAMKHLLTALVGAYVLKKVWWLVVAIRADTVEDHPLFCYEDKAATPEGVSQAFLPENVYSLAREV